MVVVLVRCLSKQTGDNIIEAITKNGILPNVISTDILLKVLE